MIVGRALRLDRQMVPCIADGIAGNAGLIPVLAGVVPNVPLMATCGSALVAPDELFPADELVDIKLESLRKFNVLHEEINVIGEVVIFGNDRMVGVVNILGREITNQVVVPQDVSPLNGSAAIDGLGREAVH